MSAGPFRKLRCDRIAMRALLTDIRLEAICHLRRSISHLIYDCGAKRTDRFPIRTFWILGGVDSVAGPICHTVAGGQVPFVRFFLIFQFIWMLMKFCQAW